jgi:molybdopterin molybdotransferase
MKSATEAKQDLTRHLPALAMRWVTLAESLGSYCAQAVIAESLVPPFDNSAMDGYAFCWQDYKPGNGMPVAGEMAAGIAKSDNFKPGTAMRIFTGAMVPEGFDTVVMQEKTRLVEGSVFVDDTQLAKGANVRKAGSQTRLGDLLLQAGHKITPGVVGFLASAGISQLWVYEWPKIAVVVTGNEVVAPGQPLLPGQVYECNGFSLRAALQDVGIQASVAYAPDNKVALSKQLQTAMDTADWVLVTGGVSVGDYDLVVPVLNELGVQTVFHRIKQKPAKPFYFGTKGEKRIFGLPGNPASVLTCWYAWIRPFLLQASGVNENNYKQTAIVQQHLTKKPGLTQFIKGYAANGQVHVLAGQESYRMDAFAEANCFVVLDEDSEGVSEGSPVNLIMFQ